MLRQFLDSFSTPTLLGWQIREYAFKAFSRAKDCKASVISGQGRSDPGVIIYSNDGEVENDSYDVFTAEG